MKPRKNTKKKLKHIFLYSSSVYLAKKKYFLQKCEINKEKFHRWCKYKYHLEERTYTLVFFRFRKNNWDKKHRFKKKTTLYNFVHNFVRSESSCQLKCSIMQHICMGLSLAFIGLSAYLRQYCVRFNKRLNWFSINVVKIFNTVVWSDQIHACFLAVFLNINGTHQRKCYNNGYVVHFYYDIEFILKDYGVIGNIVDSF